MWACTAKAEEDQENYLAEQERLEQFSSGVCVCVCVCVCDTSCCTCTVAAAGSRRQETPDLEWQSLECVANVCLE